LNQGGISAIADEGPVDSRPAEPALHRKLLHANLKDDIANGLRDGVRVALLEGSLDVSDAALIAYARTAISRRSMFKSAVRDELWKSGGFYRPDTYGAWSVEGRCLKFEGHPEVRDAMQEGRWVGAIGDNYEVKVINDTPENRAALEVAGLRPWDEAVIDGRLWIEEPAHG
jgi:hypothetical protein